MSRRPFRPSKEDWRQVLTANRARESASRLDRPVLLDVEDLPDEEQLSRDPLDYEWEAVTASMESLSRTEGIELSEELIATLRDDFIKKRQRGFEYHECLDHVEAVIREISRTGQSPRELLGLAHASTADFLHAFREATRQLEATREVVATASLDIPTEIQKMNANLSHLGSLPVDLLLAHREIFEMLEIANNDISARISTVLQNIAAAQDIINQRQNEEERAL